MTAGWLSISKTAAQITKDITAGSDRKVFEYRVDHRFLHMTPPTCRATIVLTLTLVYS